MREISTKNIFTWAILALFAYAMTILCINKLMAYAEMPILSGTFRVHLLFYVLSAIYLVMFYRSDKSSIPERLALVFSCICFVHGMLTLSISGGKILESIITLFSLPLSIMLGKTLIKQNISSILIMISLLVPFAILIKNYLEICGMEIIDLSADISFSIVVFLPFVFLCRNNILNILFLLASSYAILLTAKRSVIIALVATLLVYLYNRYFVNAKTFYQRIRSILIVILMVFAVQLYFKMNVEESEYMLERFENLSEDGGSDRDKIYPMLLRGVKESYLEEFWFGHGYQAVEKWVGHPAHNDYIEIIYDYGVIPLILYVACIISMFMYAVRNRKHCRDKMSIIGLFASVLMLLILGFFNCFITNANYVFMLGFFMGMFMGRIEMVSDNNMIDCKNNI